MSRPVVLAVLWLVCAFVVWNVVFDRQVAVDALDFTREQVLRHQDGRALTSIHAGFSPLVREAALRAAVWTSPILLAGVLAVYFSVRRNS